MKWICEPLNVPLATSVRVKCGVLKALWLGVQDLWDLMNCWACGFWVSKDHGAFFFKGQSFFWPFDPWKWRQYSPLNHGEPLAKQCHIPEDLNIQSLLVVPVGPSSHTWATSTLQDARHHRHWQRVLGQVGGLHLSTLCFPLPLSGTVLGGTMELHGNNISLACFHGINFKSKSWALFSLKEPCISFATEAQEVPSPECKCRALI